MKIEGKLIKSGKWWAVEIPLLLIYTQGKTKRHAYLMAADAVEAIVDYVRDCKYSLGVSTPIVAFLKSFTFLVIILSTLLFTAMKY